MNKTLLAAAAALGVLASASAQTSSGTGTDNYPYNFSVRGGVILPIDDSYADVSNSFFAIGVDYTFNRSFLRGGETFLSVEYQGKNLGKTNGSVFPIHLNQKFFSGRDGIYGQRTYFFVGLGASIVDFDGSDTVLSGRLGVGKELNETFFVEAALHIADESARVRANALGLYVGYRF